MTLFDCAHIAYPDLEIAIESFDDWSRYLSEPLRAEELKPFLKTRRTNHFIDRSREARSGNFKDD